MLVMSVILFSDIENFVDQNSSIIQKRSDSYTSLMNKWLMSPHITWPTVNYKPNKA